PRARPRRLVRRARGARPRARGRRAAEKHPCLMTDDDTQADALETALGDDDRRLLDKLADALARRKMLTPAIFFLESMKPLGFVASQAMVFFRPIVEAVLREPLA